MRRNRSDGCRERVGPGEFGRELPQPRRLPRVRRVAGETANAVEAGEIQFVDLHAVDAVDRLLGERRLTTKSLSTSLAEDYTVYEYDRLGRGDSGDTAPYAPEREVEDLAAIVRGTETAQRLFQNGKLRVDGDVRVAASRLSFLKGLS